MLMLTDLDRDPCPSIKINNWLGVTPSSGFLCRICVKEVEAWLLTHRDAMASILGVAVTLMPVEPESLADRKKGTDSRRATFKTTVHSGGVQAYRVCTNWTRLQSAFESIHQRILGCGNRIGVRAKFSASKKPAT